MGGFVEGVSPQWDRTVPWQDGRKFSGKVPCALCFGVPTLDGERKEGGKLS